MHLRTFQKIYVRKFEDTISKFIWDNKKPKIAKSTLQMLKKDGGLRLFDVRNKQKALKISWIKRIQDNKYFAESFLNSYPDAGWDKFWMANINKKDVKTIGTENTTVIFGKKY